MTQNNRQPNHLTDDPNLLEALNSGSGPTASEKTSRTSRDGGIPEHQQARHHLVGEHRLGPQGWPPWRTEYALATYSTEEEAALARNYADELLKRPNPVRNVIPTDHMPDEATSCRHGG
jgi:hypothetical protein